MRRYTVARNQRVVGCLSPFSLVCFPLRFFWRVYVASLGNCHIGAALPVGHSLRPRTLSQLSHTATPGHMGVPIGSARTQTSLRSDIGSPSLILGNAPGVHPSSRPPRPLLDPGTWRRPSDSASTGPFSGPILPPWQKGGDLTTFLGGCGAKSWGSGGAPPTNLILLRNQRCRPDPRARRDPVVRRRFGVGSRRRSAVVARRSRPPARAPRSSQAPTPAPVPHPAPIPPLATRVEWFGLASVATTARVGGESGVQRMERFTSVYAGYDCGASLCPGYSRRRVDGARYRDRPAP